MSQSSSTATTLTALAAGRSSRRRFGSLIGSAGLAGLGVLALPDIFGAMPATRAADATLTDADILNFALNLEYLEAEYYLRAYFGHGLGAGDVTGVGTPGDVTGGSKVTFKTSAIRQYAREIALDERAHVRFLRSALGADAVARPEIDLVDSFNAAAQAAGLVAAGGSFDPFADETSFLLGAFLFEDVGVTAYKGAARAIENKDFLEAAAGILAVEAYHAATVRTVLFALGLSGPANKISNARDSLDGPDDLDQGIRLGGRANIVPADANSIAFSRTPDQVLGIVYLGTSPGGFFPAGLNGTIS